MINTACEEMNLIKLTHFDFSVAERCFPTEMYISKETKIIMYNRIGCRQDQERTISI